MLLHADAVAQDGAAGDAAAGIDGDDADGVSAATENAGERVYESTLSCPGRTRDPGNAGVSGGQFAKDLGGARIAVFDKRRGAGKGTGVALPDLASEIGHQLFNN
jgi:hypothetical protein